ncbi:MAG: F0F1 ATP synthase subunit B [uncultured bacterium]|nr:MAG: F0F1 ATP synthase subunit B [uncultured bacterium]OGT33831.1 MAG: F0F1 ATP synthase subunit B [Gammaproteobacteria bacterium RIFCSPHIGHO2_02_FULL_39_13]OGT48916.1 MAG: F0F1 ATP synthase subunit B [Gammaproteobacteria bacterium RIFCSPHIGHO2_12_FULL_39_24]
MDINLTLFGEMLTFAVFVWFTMRFVWPPLMKAMEDRRATIAAGLAAAEKGKRDLELAQHKVTEILTEAKAQAALMIEQANHRANLIIEEGKARARVESDRLIAIARSDIEREFHSARDALLNEVSSLVIAGSEKVLQHEVNKSANDKIITEMMDAL